MTLATAPRLSEAAQALIDLRLDTIDRMLLGRVSRHDRLSIVGEAEAQIFEVLGQREVEEADRDEVLAVLARLDPPEAYVPEGAEERPAVPAERLPSLAPVQTGGGDSRVARASGIVGLSALGLVLFSPLIYLATAVTGSEVLLLMGLFGTAGLVFVGGLLAVVLAIYAQLRGVWAIVGLAVGLLAVLFSLAGGLFLIAEL